MNFFFNQPDEIVFRSLSELIHNIGNKISYTRGKKILSLISNMISTKNFKKKLYQGVFLKKLINQSLFQEKLRLFSVLLTKWYLFN